MCVCLCLLMLLLGEKFLRKGESECTRLTHKKNFFSPTQHNEALSAANKNLIFLLQMQGRSNGAAKPNRVTRIRLAMATPNAVRSKLVLNVLSNVRHQMLAGLINPRDLYANGKNAALDNSGIPHGHGENANNNHALNARDIVGDGIGE